MTWRDDYQQASFRNVNFYVQSHGVDAGRRITVHEYPGSDEATYQDFGRKPNLFTIEGYILGEDYFGDRDKLIEALDKEAPGKLVHPYRGTMTVKCMGYRYREASVEGSVVRFSMTFSEANTAILTVQGTETKVTVLSARQRALSAINDVFINSYRIAKKPYAVLSNLQETIEVGVVAIRNAKSLQDAQPELQTALDDLFNNVETIFKEAEDLSADTISLITFGTLSTDDNYQASSDNARAQFDDLLNLFTFQPVSNLGTDDPATVYSNLIVESAIAACGGLIVEMEFTSYDDAQDVQSLLFDKIDLLLMDSNTDDQIFEALRNLRTAVAQDITERASDLSRLSMITVPETTPAIALSYELYGTITKEDEIVERNNLSNGAFIPSNREIEVVVDAE